MLKTFRAIFPAKPIKPDTKAWIGARAERVCNRDKPLVSKYKAVHELLAGGE